MMRTLIIVGLAAVGVFVCHDSLAQDSKPTVLMFGKETKDANRTKFLEFSYVTPETQFKDGAAWGFQNAATTDWCYAPGAGTQIGGGGNGSIPADIILEHGILCKKGKFSIRMPNGSVTVHMWVGDWFLACSGIRRLWPQCDFKISVEGKVVVAEKITPEAALSEKWWLRGESEVYRKSTDRWARQVKPILMDYDFTAEVADGVLDIDMENVPLAAIAVVPADVKNRLDDFLARVEQERRKQFEERYPWKPQPDEPMPPVAPLMTAKCVLILNIFPCQC